ncbi:hypothetical protein BDY19DRAFT_886938, partial [Irpex rosettiformis]
FMDKFLSHLAQFTVELTPLTSKEAKKKCPGWTLCHQVAFDVIKKLVTSTKCLTIIDYDNLCLDIFIGTLRAFSWRYTGAYTDVILASKSHAIRAPDYVTRTIQLILKAPKRINYSHTGLHHLHHHRVLAILRLILRLRSTFTFIYLDKRL